MKKTAKFLIPVLVLLILVAPAFSFAQEGLVPCGKVTETGVTVNGKVYKPGEVVQCGFNDILTLVNNIIIFVFEYLAIPIAAIMFAYAGFLMITAGGEAGNARTKAKNIFLNTLIGLVIAVAAVLIVKAILTFMGYVGPRYL